MNSKKEPKKEQPQAGVSNLRIAPMSQKDWGDVIHIVRAAPLSNMDAAEAVSGLLMRLGNHVDNLG